MVPYWSFPRTPCEPVLSGSLKAMLQSARGDRKMHLAEGILIAAAQENCTLFRIKL
jgi:hypothetical protein